MHVWSGIGSPPFFCLIRRLNFLTSVELALARLNPDILMLGLATIMQRHEKL